MIFSPTSISLHSSCYLYTCTFPLIVFCCFLYRFRSCCMFCGIFAILPSFFSSALSVILSFLPQQTYPDSCHVLVHCCHGLYLPISIPPATKCSICIKTAPASMSNFSYHFFWHCCLASYFYPPNISLSVICMFLIPCIHIAF